MAEKTLGELLKEKIERDSPVIVENYSGDGSSLTKWEVINSNLCPEVMDARIEQLQQERPPLKRATWVGTTSYSALSLDVNTFRALVKRLSEDLPQLMEQTGADAILVRGTSGYSVAFAMRMLTPIPFVVARKQGECSHGSSISLVDDGNGGTISNYLILDDMIATGNTVRGMARDMMPAKCVGIVEYNELLQSLNASAQSYRTGRIFRRAVANYKTFMVNDHDMVPRFTYQEEEIYG